MREVQRLGQEIEQEPVMWEVTQGGAYKFGGYLVAERVDGKGWNARKGDEHLLLASSLNACKSACEYDATYPPQPPQRTWVGLTDEDLSVCDEDGVILARYWEAKLKQKNGYAEENT